MKNLKKFVALLLAGVMAMVLLTACGGGTDAEKEQENKILNKLSSQTEAANLVKEGNGKLQNSDSKLYESVTILEGNFFAHTVYCLSDDKKIIRFPVVLFCIFQKANALISEQ